MKLNVSLSGFKGSADITTHALKERGGSLYNGVVKIASESYESGKTQGIKIGRTQGLILSAVIMSVFWGASCFYKKYIEINQTEGEFTPSFLGDLTQEELLNCIVDTEFPWDEIKEKIKCREDIADLSYEMWINPLSCRAYGDRVLVEVSDEKISCEFISKKYRHLIQECIYEVTGKVYIVSIVRPGEILIEDMD